MGGLPPCRGGASCLCLCCAEHRDPGRWGDAADRRRGRICVRPPWRGRPDLSPGATAARPAHRMQPQIRFTHTKTVVQTRIAHCCSCVPIHVLRSAARVRARIHSAACCGRPKRRLCSVHLTRSTPSQPTAIINAHTHTQHTHTQHTTHTHTQHTHTHTHGGRILTRARRNLRRALMTSRRLRTGRGRPGWRRRSQRSVTAPFISRRPRTRRCAPLQRARTSSAWMS